MEDNVTEWMFDTVATDIEEDSLPQRSSFSASDRRKRYRPPRTEPRRSAPHTLPVNGMGQKNTKVVHSAPRHVAPPNWHKAIATEPEFSDDSDSYEDSDDAAGARTIGAADAFENITKKVPVSKQPIMPFGARTGKPSASGPSSKPPGGKRKISLLPPPPPSPSASMGTSPAAAFFNIPIQDADIERARVFIEDQQAIALQLQQLPLFKFGAQVAGNLRQPIEVVFPRYHDDITKRIALGKIGDLRAAAQAMRYANDAEANTNPGGLLLPTPVYKILSEYGGLIYAFKAQDAILHRQQELYALEQDAAYSGELELSHAFSAAVSNSITEVMGAYPHFNRFSQVDAYLYDSTVMTVFARLVATNMSMNAVLNPTRPYLDKTFDRLYQQKISHLRTFSTFTSAGDRLMYSPTRAFAQQRLDDEIRAASGVARRRVGYTEASSYDLRVQPEENGYFFPVF